MEKLNTFIINKRDLLGKVFETHYVLYLIKQKNNSHTSLIPFKNSLIDKLKKYLSDLNCTSIYSEELYSSCDEYISYAKKYKNKQVSSSRRITIDQFVYDIYMFVTKLRYVLNKLSNEVMNIDIDYLIKKIQKCFNSNNNIWEHIPINVKYVDKLTVMLEDLKVLQLRWFNIINNETELEESIKQLQQDANNWKKYKHLLSEIIHETN